MLREMIAIPMSPQERLEYDHEVAELRQAMGAEFYASVWAEGREMPLDQAIGFASVSDSGRQG